MGEHGNPNNSLGQIPPFSYVKNEIVNLFINCCRDEILLRSKKIAIKDESFLLD